MAKPIEQIQEQMNTLPKDMDVDHRLEVALHIVLDQAVRDEVINHADALNIREYLMSHTNHNLMWSYIDQFDSMNHWIQAWRFQIQPNYHRHKLKKVT